MGVFSRCALREVAFAPSRGAGGRQGLQRPRLSSFSHQQCRWVSAPTPAARGSLAERRSPSTLGSQGRFCGVFSGQAGASRPSLVEINSVKRWLRCARHRGARTRGSRCPGAPPGAQHRHRPYCRMLQCSPGKGSTSPSPGGWQGCACRGMRGRVTSWGNCCNVQAAAVALGFSQPGARGFSGCFNRW